MKEKEEQMTVQEQQQVMLANRNDAPKNGFKTYNGKGKKK